MEESVRECVGSRGVLIKRRRESVRECVGTRGVLTKRRREKGRDSARSI